MTHGIGSAPASFVQAALQPENGSELEEIPPKYLI
jgi:hypothetical protein